MNPLSGPPAKGVSRVLGLPSGTTTLGTLARALSSGNIRRCHHSCRLDRKRKCVDTGPRCTLVLTFVSTGKGVTKGDEDVCSQGRRGRSAEGRRELVCGRCHRPGFGPTGHQSGENVDRQG